MNDTVHEFVIESVEGLDLVDQHLVALEQDPKNDDLLAEIFRSIHNVKGACGFLGYSHLESVTHAGESLLCRLREHELSLTSEITTVLLNMSDAVRKMLGAIGTTGTDGDDDHAELVQALERLQNGESQAGVIDGAAGTATTRSTKTATKRRRKKSTRRKSVAKPEVPPPSMPEHSPSDAMSAQPQDTFTPAAAETSIRVEVELLDRLMNLVGELVLARNQIMQNAQDLSLSSSAQHLNLITTELQEGVMRTRMQPIDNISGKLPRVVRDLALSCGKKVRFDVEGAETELDKTLIEAIKDPITHIVRNSVDHGIEEPEARTASGKTPEGHIVLRAYHEGGQVNIEITDDGGGIDSARLKQQAIDRGLITSDQAERMGERDAVSLIFHPGLSTAQTVTNVSGRGVGMDVVKTNIESIGGSVDVRSPFGMGTTLKLKIPLTLAIIPALVARSGNNDYAIPQASLLELVRLESDEVKTKIEDIRGAPVYRLRGRLLPLVFLDRELRGGSQSPEPAGDVPDRTVNIVVLQADDRPFGLVVDAVSDTAEIVVKPMGRLLKDLSIFAGATIMGNGRVALILDVLGLAQRASVISELQQKELAGIESEETETKDDRQTLLLFRSADDGRMALPLSKVTRLEEFSADRIERTGTQDVMQYRGGILPLIHIADVLPERRGAPRTSAEAVEEDAVHVIVYTTRGRSVGLVVDRIVDIVDEVVSLERPAVREGVLGSAVIQNRITEFVDIEAILRASHFQPPEQAA